MFHYLLCYYNGFHWSVFSVAKECSSRIDVLLKDKKIDCDSSSLSSREQAVRNILCGLRDILHVIMKLESVN